MFTVKVTKKTALVCVCHCLCVCVPQLQSSGRGLTASNPPTPPTVVAPVRTPLAKSQTRWLQMWASNPSFLPVCVPRLALTYLSKHAFVSRAQHYTCYPRLYGLITSLHLESLLPLCECVHSRAGVHALCLRVFCRGERFLSERRHSRLIGWVISPLILFLSALLSLSQVSNNNRKKNKTLVRSAAALYDVKKS